MGKSVQPKWYHNLPSVNDAKLKAEEILNQKIDWKPMQFDGYHFEANLENVRVCIFNGVNPITLVITNYIKEKIDG